VLADRQIISNAYAQQLHLDDDDDDDDERMNFNVA